MYLVQLVYRKEIKKQGERKLLREIGEVSYFFMTRKQSRLGYIGRVTFFGFYYSRICYTSVV
jgi:hypothetical protein